MTQQASSRIVRRAARSGSTAADTVAANLAEVRRHAVELLGQLNHTPRALRLKVGEVCLDITWPEHAGTPVAVGQVVSEIPATHGPAQASPGEDDADQAGQCLTSPGVGVFYHAPEPGAEPFVSVGTRVATGQQIGIIEAMKLMIPVEADRAGTITAVLKANGEPVEYAEPLFALDVEEV